MGFIDRQLPHEGETFLDHVGLFVADEAAAASALKRLGFSPTPFTVQTNPGDDGAPPIPTGTGNRCVLLRRGYLEVLVKTADTPLAAEFSNALERYAGQHLTAFASADAAGERMRLARAGFPVRPLVALRRNVDTETGTAELAFTVARVAPGAMAEGRIQFLTHHTEAAMWQARWLHHRNTAQALTDQAIVVADVAEAAARWERFLGAAPVPIKHGRLFDVGRGRVALVSVEAMDRVAPGVAAPAPPFMAALGVEVSDLAACTEALGDLSTGREPGRTPAVLPAPLGQGMLHFTSAGTEPPWL